MEWTLHPGERTLKAAGSFDRVVGLEQTLALIPPLRKRFGITRLAETTYLDRADVPTYAAIVPRSPDLLGVYGGKGTTRQAARVSAVMEAVERQVGAVPRLQSHYRPACAVAAELDLDPRTVRAGARAAPVECFQGRDLISGEMLSVPRAMVQCPWPGPRFLEGGINTNGLAAGNTFIEACFHALCEVVERHTWSMYHAKCALVPRFYGGPSAPDAALAEEISFPTGRPEVDELAAKLTAARLRVRAFWLHDAKLPHVMLAGVTDATNSPAMFHTGLGCSLSPAHALTRALTEAVQSRTVDIQGSREDILREGEDSSIYTNHARRCGELPLGRWYFDLPALPVQFSQLADRSSCDILGDLQTVVESLEALGAPRVVAIDLTRGQLPVSVVRVVVPSLEKTAIDGTIGPRAAALFNPFALR